MRTAARGVQIYTPEVVAPLGAAKPPDPKQVTVPALGGGVRRVDAVPWELAQLPFVDQSASLGAVLEKQFADHQVALFARPTAAAPMRILRGAHMPAILIELGFLSNGDDEGLISNAAFQSSIIESIIAALGEVRRGVPAGTEGR